MNLSRKQERIAIFLKEQEQCKADKIITEKNALADTHPKDHFSLRRAKNTPQEVFFLTCAEEFQSEHPCRKLLFKAKNEYNVEKLVCTTLRPTLIPFPELGGCDTIESYAVFVAQFLQYERLTDLCQLPLYLPSSMQILKWNGTADCFDYSTFLVSVLLGSGYDAYVVQGYAPICICERDRTCPDYLFAKGKSDLGAAISVETGATETRDEIGSTQLIHCWVFVNLTNSQHAKNENYTGMIFIEPTTGDVYPLSAQERIPYIGVETVWNAKNHWINLQETNTVQNISFDLTNRELWRPLNNSKGSSDLVHEMPTSWADKISLLEESVQLRYLPEGERFLLDYKMKVELFAEGVHPDGILSRVSSFNDVARTDLICCKEVYEKRRRKDYLSVRIREPRKIQEIFYPGHKDGISSYTVIPGKSQSILFYLDARIDGLVKQEEEFGELVVKEYNNNNNVEGTVKRVLTLTKNESDEIIDDCVLLIPSFTHDKVRVVKVVDTFDYTTRGIPNDYLYKRTYDLEHGLIEERKFQNIGSKQIIKQVYEKEICSSKADEERKMMNEVSCDEKQIYELIDARKRNEYNFVYSCLDPLSLAREEIINIAAIPVISDEDINNIETNPTKSFKIEP